MAIFSLSAAISILPDTPAGVTSTISGFVNGFIYVFTYINWFLPIPAILSVLAVIFIVENAYFGYSVIVRIIRVLTLGFVDLR